AAKKVRMDCFASLAMTWMVRWHTQVSSPAKAGDPVRRGFSFLSSVSLGYWIVRRSLSSGGHSADPVADDDSYGCGFAFSRRETPEACKYFRDLSQIRGRRECRMRAAPAISYAME